MLYLRLSYAIHAALVCAYMLHYGSYLVFGFGDVMKAVSVRQLKSDPSAALRDARDQPVVILNRQGPEALLVHLGDNSLLAEPGIRLALATALYKDESLSLGRAAEFSGQALADFIGHISRLGISVVRGANTVSKDAATLDKRLGGRQL